MQPLSAAAGREFQWHGKEEFVLWAGDEVYAILRAREREAAGTIGEAADGRWALKRQYISSGELLVITEHDARAQVAVVQRGRKHGLFARDDDYLEFADGHLVAWHKTSAWRGDAWDWIDREERPLIHFRRGHRVVIGPDARSLRELSPLVIAGGQLVRLLEAARKKAAVAASVETATASRVVVNH